MSTNCANGSSTRHSNDAFERVLGNGRGVTDTRALGELLASTERNLSAAHQELGQLCSETDAFNQRLDELDAIVVELQTELSATSMELRWCERDRDLARYCVVRSGGQDPLVAGVNDEHHGIWTPGRPFLTGQHVYEPLTGACYSVTAGGAAAGERPHESRRWRRCRGGRCPAPGPIPTTPHPVGSGYALRQREHWWDATGRRWNIHDLASDHLIAVIDYLRDFANPMRDAELSDSRTYVPCPANAYPSASTWLSDCPLMRVLLAERRRRGLRRPRREQQWRWGDDQAF
jgi:hypothetical protein